MAARISYFIQVLILWDFSQCYGQCNGSTSSQSGENCWYALWYLWFILVLFVVGVSVLVMFYCKVRAKNRVTTISGTGRRPNQVATQPVLPPPYSANDPGYPPPSYQAAIATQTLPPGYVGEQATATRQPRSQSVLSNPPPYSPPHTNR